MDKCLSAHIYRRGYMTVGDGGQLQRIRLLKIELSDESEVSIPINAPDGVHLPTDSSKDISKSIV